MMASKIKQAGKKASDTDLGTTVANIRRTFHHLNVDETTRKGWHFRGVGDHGGLGTVL